MKPSRLFYRSLLLVMFLTLIDEAVSFGQVGKSVHSASTATVNAVRFHVSEGQTRVWLETTGAVLYTHYNPDPMSLVIDLPGADISALDRRINVGSKEVESIITTTLDQVDGRQLSRIEIKLAEIAPFQISSSEQSLNIVFDGSVTAPSVSSTSPEMLVHGGSVFGGASNLGLRGVEDGGIQEEVIPPPVTLENPATAIFGITYEVLDGLLKVHLAADGWLNYTSFELDGPPRLVFDFNGVLNTVRQGAMAIDELGVDRVRVSQFRTANPQIMRVVFDHDGGMYYGTRDQDEGVEIIFSRSEERIETIASSSSLLEETNSTQKSRWFSESEMPLSEVAVDNLSGPLVVASTMVEDSSVASRSMSDFVISSQDGGTFPVEIVTEQIDSLPDDSLAALPQPPPVTIVEPLPQNSEQSFLDPSGEAQYTGDLITLDFKDGDIQDIFRLFADISGLNLVVQPGVSGRVTLRLTEVPWDQALQLILKTNKLGYVVEGNVIRIAPLSELAAEEAEKRELAEEMALTGELFTRTRVLSYAKASEIMPLLQRNLSARGDIVTDERTNTVIFTDLSGSVAAINNLIDALDTPIPGVEIEARIVVTTRTFARQLGVQWGFTGNQTQAHGNTTELTFPNRIQLDGQPIGSTTQRNFQVPGATSGGVAPPQISEGTLQVQRGYAVNLPFAGAPTGAVGLSLGSITGAFNIDAAISAAERRGQVRIISAPKIITQNNKAAEIKQGTTFPVQVVANNTITVQFKDAVLDLAVTPQITSAATIILDIAVNNASLDFGRQVNGITSIVTQAATTQVLVADGSTTVIGGVFVNTQQVEEQYVPLLHKIPVLGRLFKSKSMDTRNEELLIFLTPRIRKDTL